MLSAIIDLFTNFTCLLPINLTQNTICLLRGATSLAYELSSQYEYQQIMCFGFNVCLTNFSNIYNNKFLLIWMFIILAIVICYLQVFFYNDLNNTVLFKKLQCYLRDFFTVYSNKFSQVVIILYSQYIWMLICSVRVICY